MRDRRLLFVLPVLALVALATPHRPTATIRIATEAAGDPAPHRFAAAVDLGVVAVDVLYTWTVRRLP